MISHLGISFTSGWVRTQFC